MINLVYVQDNDFLVDSILVECNIALKQKDVRTVSSIEQCQGCQGCFSIVFYRKIDSLCICTCVLTCCWSKIFYPSYKLILNCLSLLRSAELISSNTEARKCLCYQRINKHCITSWKIYKLISLLKWTWQFTKGIKKNLTLLVNKFNFQASFLWLVAICFTHLIIVYLDILNDVSLWLGYREEKRRT